MNITLYIYGIEGKGGAEVFTRRLADSLVHRGHNTTLLTTQSIRRWLSGQSIVEHVNGLRIIRLPVSYKGEFRIFARMLLIETFFAFPFLLRHTNVLHIRKLDSEAINLGRIAHFWKVKSLCIPMASGPYGDVATFPAVKGHDSNAFDWLSSLTEHVRQEAIEWGYPANRISIIPNGVDTTFFMPPEEAAAIDHVIFIGQFRVEKRVGFLLDAWKKLQSTYPNARLTLVGGAKVAPQYQKMAEDLGIKPTFIASASTQEVCNWLQSNSIFVLPSVTEGMSNALLEAMAVGLACIVGNNPGNRALISHEVNGLVLDADTPEAIAAAIRRLLDDYTLCERLGKAARQTVLEKYSLDAIVDQYIALYQRIAGS